MEFIPRDIRNSADGDIDGGSTEVSLAPVDLVQSFYCTTQQLSFACLRKTPAILQARTI
jgi:hypothetical protein